MGFYGRVAFRIETEMNCEVCVYMSPAVTDLGIVAKGGGGSIIDWYCQPAILLLPWSEEVSADNC